MAHQHSGKTTHHSLHACPCMCMEVCLSVFMTVCVSVYACGRLGFSVCVVVVHVCLCVCLCLYALSVCGCLCLCVSVFDFVCTRCLYVAVCVCLSPCAICMVGDAETYQLSLSVLRPVIRSRYQKEASRSHSARYPCSMLHRWGSRYSFHVSSDSDATKRNNSCMHDIHANITGMHHFEEKKMQQQRISLTV